MKKKKKGKEISQAVSQPAAALEWLNDPQVAALFGVTKRMLRLWRRRGLPYHKPTKKIIRYRKSEVEAWMDASRVAEVA